MKESTKRVWKATDIRKPSAESHRSGNRRFVSWYGPKRLCWMLDRGQVRRNKERLTDRTNSYFIQIGWREEKGSRRGLDRDHSGHFEAKKLEANQKESRMGQGKTGQGRKRRKKVKQRINERTQLMQSRLKMCLLYDRQQSGPISCRMKEGTRRPKRGESDV